MTGIQQLKKKLRSIRSTQKVSKAMKTVSAAKYSKLSAVYTGYSHYVDAYASLPDEYRRSFTESFPAKNPSAPALFVVFAGNRRNCGAFNSQVCDFAKQKISEYEGEYVLWLLGRQVQAALKGDKNIDVSDTPKKSDGDTLFESITNARADGEISDVYFIYPEYRNMMIQTPTMLSVFEKTDNTTDTEDILHIPDKKTVLESISGCYFSTLCYGTLLKTALGAQAATLMTMRSAYDNATELCDALEGEIHRKRQAQITAAVIETSTEIN